MAVSPSGVAPGRRTLHHARRAIRALLVAIIAGICMVALDGTAVNVALPRLVLDFRGTLPALQWTIKRWSDLMYVPHG